MEKTVQRGDKVRVDYIGSFEDGKLFDTSIANVAKEGNIFFGEREYTPLEFSIGSGQMIKGFEKAIMGMKAGEEKTVSILPEEGYGEYSPKLIQEMPRQMFSQNSISLKEGTTLILESPNGLIKAKVLKIYDEKVVLDLNHELAGKKLIFKLILKDIV